MSFQPGANLYTQAFGSRPENVEVPHLDTRAPASTDVGPNYPIGKHWVNTSAGTEYVLTSKTTSNGVTTANWTLLGSGGSGAINSITGDSGGAEIPSAGNFNLLGTAHQIAVTGSANTETFSLVGPYTPATYTAHGVLVGEGTSSIVALSVGTTGQVLIGSTGADPAFGALGVNSGLTVHGVLLGENNSAIAATTAGSNGQVLLGSTSADPAFGTLTTSTGVAFTTGAASLAIDIKAGGFAVTPVAGASQALAAQHTYIANDTAQTTFTLPATGVVGDLVRIVGSSLNTGGWKITYTTGQYIVGPAGSSTTTTGNAATGAAGGQSATLVCTATNLEWTIVANSGTITLT